MALKERDEKKRSVLWRVVILGSTLVIILVLGFFITNSLFGNPLEGEWVSEEKGYYLEIDDDNKLTVEGTFNGEYVEIELRYTLDRTDKLITIKALSDEQAELLQIENIWTTDETSETGDSSTVTFEYSLGRKTLTLTDREYGEQFVFTRK